MGLTKGNLAKQLTVGGYTFDWDPVNNPNDVLLHAGATDGTSNTYHTARLSNGTVGYQVPAGKTLKIIGMDLITTAAYAAQWSIGYGDTDVGTTAAAGPTNAVFTSGSVPMVVVEATAGKFGSRGGMNFSVPTGKFPFSTSAGSVADRSNVMIFCRLV